MGIDNKEIGEFYFIMDIRKAVHDMYEIIKKDNPVYDVYERLVKIIQDEFPGVKGFPKNY